MSAFLLAIKKIIAVLTAIFIPTTSAATIPAIPNHARVVKVSVSESLGNIENSQMEIVEDEEGINPVINENGENTEDPANDPQPLALDEQEAPADDIDHTRAEEIPAVQSWDVSATEDDNVTMTFYDTEDTDALLEQLAGRITALFTPMTAYAADDDEDAAPIREVDNEKNPTLITEGNSKIEIIREEQGVIGDSEFGQESGDTRQATYPAGTVVVSGNGNMMDYVYNYFIDIDHYVETTVELFEEVHGISVNPIYDHKITDIIDLEENIVYIDIDTEEEVFVDEDMRQRLNPLDMLKYSPTHIIIADGVTNVSDYAFAMCANIVSVDMPEGLIFIGEGAFMYCKNLEIVNMPYGLIEIGESAFAYCSKLANVHIPETVEYIGYFAFENIQNNAVISTGNTTILKMFVDKDLTGQSRVTLQFAL